MLYAPNPPDANPFDDFDRGLKQRKYKKAKTASDLFKVNLERGNQPCVSVTHSARIASSPDSISRCLSCPAG